MAWTSPMTALANTGYTAAQYNRYIRDNLLETAPAKATSAGQTFVCTGLNEIATRRVTSAIVATSQTTTSTTYTDLATAGPSITVETGRECLVWWSCEISNNTTNSASLASFAYTGVNVNSANDDWNILFDGLTANNAWRMSGCRRLVFLNKGTITFTMKYRVGSGTGTFANREITCLPL